jgi:hypothetical protein
MMMPFHTSLTFDFCVFLQYVAFFASSQPKAPLNAANPLCILSSRTNVHIHAFVRVFVESSQFLETFIRPRRESFASMMRRS